MGAGMDRIIPGIYVGSIRDSKDTEQIKKNNITHILSIYEDSKEGNIENVVYKCFKAADHAQQDIKKYFEEAIDFIHSARLNNGNVLVHCLAGISRSTTLVISYVMTISELPWYDSLNAVRAARKGANPNFGFQRQLQNFEYTTLKKVRAELYEKYGVYDNSEDLKCCIELLELYKQTQKSIITDTSNQVNYNPTKTYPLAFNAYNLDEENPNNLSKNDKKEDLVPKKEDELNEEEVKKEKERIVDTLFG